MLAIDLELLCAPETPPEPGRMDPRAALARRLVAFLGRHCASRLGSVGAEAWRIDGPALTHSWARTGGFLSVTEGDGELEVSWLLVDPSGEAPVDVGFGTPHDARVAVEHYAERWRGAPAGADCSDERFWWLVEETDLRLELLQGRVFAMAGGSVNHNRICVSVGSELERAFAPRGCSAMNSDQYIYAPEVKSTFVFPDVTVLCGEPEYVRSGGRSEVLANPTVLVEVLSEGTKAHDETVKLAGYKQIASLQAYLLVSQERREVTVYRREGDAFVEEVVRGGSFEVHGATLHVDAFYRQVELHGHRATASPDAPP